MSTARSFELKVERAREHLQRLELEVGEWLDTEPYHLVVERDPEPVHELLHGDAMFAAPRRFRVVHVEPIPQRFSLLIGDCVFNLRASLDHLAMSLARAFTPGMTREQLRGSEFPIFGETQMRAAAERQKIGCIDPAAAAIIKSLQPYHRGHSYQDDPLWLIHELNRMDKHRALTICTSVAMSQGHPAIGFRVGFDINQFLYFSATPGELVMDAVLMRYAFRIPAPIDDVNVEPVFSAEITFGKGAPAELQPVIPTLCSLCDFVCDPVIAQLSKFL